MSYSSSDADSESDSDSPVSNQELLQRYVLEANFIHVQEIFARFTRAMYSRIFLAMNQSLTQAYLNITGLNKA